MATAVITPEKIEFTDAQQTHIQKLFDARFATIKQKAEAEAQAVRDELDKIKKENDDLKKKVNAEPDGGHKDSAEKEQMAALLRAEQQNTAAAKDAFVREKERADGLAAQNAEILKTQAIISAASNLENGLEFHDLPMVIELVKNMIFLDKDTNQYVVKINGVVKMNKALQPMMLGEFFMEYAAQRPYLVKSQAKPGAGSHESGSGDVGQGGVGVIRTKADLKTVAAKSAYISKFGIDAFTKLPAK
jgi:hypothetical protein